MKHRITAMTSRMRASKRLHRHLVGLLAGAVYLTALLATAKDVGFTRDEGFYFSAARSYQKWFDVLIENPSDALTKKTIDRYWSNNHEHPALMKTLFGFSERFFHKKWQLMGPSTAMRLPAMLTAAATLYLLIVFGAEIFGLRAGIAAALFFALMPRVFFHAHLACFDVPITFMWLLVFYLYYRSLASRRFGVAAGVALGFALAVKLNAFFIPFLAALHYAALALYQKRRGEPKASAWAFLFGAVLAPIIFLAHWPWVWHDTLPRLLGYMGFHSGHPHYNTAWFGENVVQAPTPILLPLGMTLFTVPTVIILLFCIGACLRLAHHLPDFIERRLGRTIHPVGPVSKNGFDLLWFLAAAFPIALISMPNVPVFGGTKHWMPSYPFIALIAGAAVSRMTEVVDEVVPARARTVSAVLLTTLVALPPLQQTITSHPFGLASYVPFIGGAPGAASIGLTRQFWGYTTRGVIPWLNDHHPEGARVEIHDTYPASWRMYIEEGSMSPAMKASNLASANVALMHHELHMVRNEAWIWNRFGTFSPAHVLTYQGVPIVSVYELPKRDKK